MFDRMKPNVGDCCGEKLGNRNHIRGNRGILWLSCASEERNDGLGT
jgi:hypothetical protein